MDRAKYMRGLHVHSSYILLILNHFPINYLDRSHINLRAGRYLPLDKNERRGGRYHE
jgi:hypothetical protein